MSLTTCEEIYLFSGVNEWVMNECLDENKVHAIYYVVIQKNLISIVDILKCYKTHAGELGEEC